MNLILGTIHSAHKADENANPQIMDCFRVRAGNMSLSFFS
jgi:hypothetical protein